VAIPNASQNSLILRTKATLAGLPIASRTDYSTAAGWMIRLQVPLNDIILK